MSQLCRVYDWIPSAVLAYSKKLDYSLIYLLYSVPYLTYFKADRGVLQNAFVTIFSELIL